MSNERAFGLDTYYGEGKMFPDKGTQFDWFWFKVSHGGWGFYDYKFRYSERCENIAQRCGYYDIRGAYMWAEAFTPWRPQAEAYLRSVKHIEDKYHAKLQFDVIDAERKWNLDANGKYPAVYAKKLKWIAEEIWEKRDRQPFLYMDVSTYLELFVWNGCTWQEKYPLIVAQYPFPVWNERMRDVPNDMYWQPNLASAKGHLKIEQVKAWQFDDKYPVDGFMESKAADVNVWLGSKENMMSYLNILPKPSRGLKFRTGGRRFGHRWRMTR